MLLKIRNSNYEWLVLDNVESITYTKQNINIDRQKLDVLFSKFDRHYLYLDEDTNEDLEAGDPITVCMIKFEKEDQYCVVVFDHTCFVCNDFGNTVERISVHNGKAK